MANTTPLLWATDELAKFLPLTKEFSAVQTWNNDLRKFEDTQQTDSNGLPLWESEALLRMDWNGDLTPVRIRVAYKAEPSVKPNPDSLMTLIGGTTPTGATTSTTATKPSVSADSLRTQRRL